MTVDEARIERAIRVVFDLSPGGIIRDLGLSTVTYLPTAAYGHFGRSFPREETPRVQALRDAAHDVSIQQQRPGAASARA